MSERQISERQKRLASLVSTLPEKQVNLSILQKMVFLCAEQIASCDLKYSFIKGHYGPFSKEIVKDLEGLQETGLVQLHGTQIRITGDIENKWGNAEKTVCEFKEKFPDKSSIVVSAITSPNVINRAVGEPITISR